MTTAFQLRIAVTCDRLARQLSDLADEIRIAGLAAAASTARSISDTLARLAFDAAKQDVLLPLGRISKETGAASRGLREIAKAVLPVDISLEKRAEAAAVELSKLCHDALSQTQPIG